MAKETPASQAGSENTILVISSATEEARRFIRQLIGTSAAPAAGSADTHSNGQNGTDGEHDPDLLPWLIENKYYSAQIFFRICDVDEVELWERGTEVVLYAFVGSPPNPLPPALTKMMVARPRDIALAVKLATSDSPPFTSDDEEVAEELFDELGLELVVEDEPPEDDDERPITPLESVKQTLMTHMWPNMQRKPLGVRMPMTDEDDNARLPEHDLIEQAMGGKSLSGQDDPPASFAVDFAASDGSSGAAPHADVQFGSFPDIADLRSQIATANLAALRDLVEHEESGGRDGSQGEDSQHRNDARGLRDDNVGLDAEAGPSVPSRRGVSNMMSMLDRLEALDMANERDHGSGGPGAWGMDEDDEDDDFMRDDIVDQREYDRLEDWLGEDDEDMVAWPNGDSDIVVLPEHAHRQNTASARPEQPDEAKFEDDFDGFQSAPAPPLRTDAHPRPTANLQIPLDPTPLLLHLQSVRAELMGVTDEDERRLRAGQEVERVMRSLGMFDDNGLAGLL